MKITGSESEYDYPARIVCLSYDVVKIFGELGCTDRIIGIPSGAGGANSGLEHAQDIGGYGSPDPDKITGLKPDLVIGYSEISALIVSRLIKQGINTLALQHASLEETYDTIFLLGKICGKTGEAKKLMNKLQADFRDITAGQPARSRPPVVYFEEWDKPYVCGMKWISEVIDITGGVDGFAHRSSPSKYLERAVTTEEVVAVAPDIIIASWCGKPVDIDSIKQRPGWESIPAVIHDRVYEVPGEIILQPGPALVEGARYLSDIFSRYSE